MPKVQAQAGMSLADAYNVQGSVAGIDELISREVHLQHEMGGTIFSERLSGRIVRATTGATIQNTAFDTELTGLPDGIYRVIGLTVLADVTGRLAFCQVSLRDTTNGNDNEIPIFVWDTDNDVTSDVRIDDNGVLGNQVALVPAALPFVPVLCIGPDQPQQVGSQIFMRGLTTGFGAGDVTVVALAYLAFQSGGVSSIGLPVPSW